MQKNDMANNPSKQNEKQEQINSATVQTSH